MSPPVQGNNCQIATVLDATCSVSFLPQWSMHLLSCSDHGVISASITKDVDQDCTGKQEAAAAASGCHVCSNLTEGRWRRDNESMRQQEVSLLERSERWEVFLWPGKMAGWHCGHSQSSVQKVRASTLKTNLFYRRRSRLARPIFSSDTARRN